MKKAIKRLMTLVLCTSLMFGISSKASALEPRATTLSDPFTPSVWHNMAHSWAGDFSEYAGVMNASTDGSVTNLTKVNLYAFEAVNSDVRNRTQKFLVANPDGLGYRVYVNDQYNALTAFGYTLNRYTVSPTSEGYKCVLYRNLSSEVPYSVIDLRTVSAANRQYRIQLVSGGYYLQSPSPTSSADLRWANYQENNKFLWQSVNVG